MSNINFFRVLQNFTAASDVQEYNFFNVVASGSGHFDACGSWPRYWENRQVDEGGIWTQSQFDPFIAGPYATQSATPTCTWTDYGGGQANYSSGSGIYSGFGQSATNKAVYDLMLSQSATTIPWTQSGYRFYTSGENFEEGGLSANTYYSASLRYLQTQNLENPWSFTLIGNQISSNTSQQTQVKTYILDQFNINSLNIVDSVKSGSCFINSWDSTTYMGGGVPNDNQGIVDLKWSSDGHTASIWIISASVSHTQTDVKQYYLAKPYQAHAIPSIATGPNVHMVLNTGADRIPAGMNFTNDGMECIWVCTNGANVRIIAAGLETPYDLGTRRFTSSFDITTEMKSATTTSGDYTQPFSSFIMQDYTGSKSVFYDKLIISQMYSNQTGSQAVSATTTTTSWVINNNGSSISLSLNGKSLPKGRPYPGSGGNSVNELLGRKWSAPIYGYSEYNNYSINRQEGNAIYCIDNVIQNGVSGSGNVIVSLGLFSLAPITFDGGFCP